MDKYQSKKFKLDLEVKNLIKMDEDEDGKHEEAEPRKVGRCFLECCKGD